MTKGNVMAILFVIIVVVFGIYSCVRAEKDCARRGGVLVQGAVGYACVAQPGSPIR